MPQAIIFDVDGTLIDSVDAHASSWQRALAEFGVEVPLEQIRPQIGKGGDQIIPMFFPPEEAARLQQPLDERKREIFQRDYLPQLKPFPRVRELFERIIADGKLIALASSSKADEVAHYAKLANIEDLVATSTSGDDAQRSKPAPDIFAAALKKLPADAAEDAVVVGDSPFDAEAARQLQIPTIGLLCGGFSAESLLASGCRQIYRDPAELLERYAESLIVRSLEAA